MKSLCCFSGPLLSSWQYDLPALAIWSSARWSADLLRQWNHVGKYLLVNSNNEIIAGAESDGDSVFLRQNAAGSGTQTTITLSPVKSPSYYVAFDAVSRKAQLEMQLTDRSKLELFTTQIRPNKETDEDVSGLLAL